MTAVVGVSALRASVSGKLQIIRGQAWCHGVERVLLTPCNELNRHCSAVTEVLFIWTAPVHHVLAVPAAGRKESNAHLDFMSVPNDGPGGGRTRTLMSKKGPNNKEDKTKTLTV